MANSIDFDDDSGSGLNSRITKMVEPNKEYMLVVCKYNPSVSHSTNSYILSIIKTNTGPMVLDTMNYLEIQGVKKNSNKWTVTFINPNPYRVRVEYNSKMCLGSDATNYSRLSDLETIYLSAYRVTSVTISENWFAGYITMSLRFVSNSESVRLITYANGLSNDSCNLSSYYQTI